MKFLIILLAKAIYFFCKILNLNTSIVGKFALKLDEHILKDIYLPDNVIIVTGSNGKKSITKMIYDILKNAGFTITCNLSNNNDVETIGTAIIKDSLITGKLKKDIVLLTCNELDLEKIFKHFKPKYLVVSNIYRNNTKVNGHPEFVLNSINNNITHSIHLILNSDDPISSLLAYKRDNITFFGINENLKLIIPNNPCYSDSIYCPNCKNVLEYEYYNNHQLGKYKCNKCNHMRKEPKYAITDLDFAKGHLTINKKFSINIKNKNLYNAYNLLTAFSVAQFFGIDEKLVISTLNEFEKNNNNINRALIGNKELELLPVKKGNSTSYNEAINYIINEHKKCSVIIEIHDNNSKEVTFDTSWLWEVNFENLNNRFIEKVFLIDKYNDDLVTRLKNMFYDYNKFIILENYASFINELTEIEAYNTYIVYYSKELKKYAVNKEEQK